MRADIGGRGIVTCSLGHCFGREDYEADEIQQIQQSVTAGGRDGAPGVGRGRLARWRKPSAGYVAKDVAPILQQNCQECHRPGSIGPMPLLTYEQVMPYAGLIKYKVANRLMPPWHVDKTVGIQDFKADLSLSDEEIETIVSWADAGAPLGDPADMPPPRDFPAFSDVWQFEEMFGRPPDLVISNPLFKLHAAGLDQWPDLEVPLEGLGRGAVHVRHRGAALDPGGPVRLPPRRPESDTGRGAHGADELAGGQGR